MARELFKPLYSPPGYKYKDAKAAGLLRESQAYWIRLRHQGRTIRESTKTDNHAMARQFLAEKKASLAKGEPQVRHASHVTFAEMAEKLKRDYDLNGKHRPTLDARL